MRFTPKSKPKLVDPFLAYHDATLREAGDSQLRFNSDTWKNDPKEAVGCDVEVYPNFFVACFTRFSDGARIAFEMSERCSLDRAGLSAAMQGNLIITFNGQCFDLPIIYLALQGASNARLKEASDQIIKNDWKPWQVERELKVRIPKINHIDLIEPNPSVRQGLKILAGRLHQRFLVDLPFDPDTMLTPHQMNVTTLYCFNDIDATHLVYDAMREPLNLRIALSDEYKMDLRSLSDAQIGEAVAKKRVEQLANKRIGRAVAPAGSFGYNVPDFISFQTEELKILLEDIKVTQFSLNREGKPVTPPSLENREIKIGSSTYSLGIGGLHSQEEHRALHSTNHKRLVDIDVSSQYPNIISKLGLFPKAFGPQFLDVYRSIIAERLKAKERIKEILHSPEHADELRKLIALEQGFKISLNGQYGKFGSPYSPLFAPHLSIATTLTGQLSMLMLIEQAELNGIDCKSSNTDGALFYVDRDLEETLDNILADWEAKTSFPIEKNYYKAIYNSSVNTYIAINESGKVKRKGAIGNPWAENDLRGMMSKNPQMCVVSDAVLAHVQHGKPIEESIRECTDPRMFLTVIKAATGAMWRGTPLGRVVRYYWSTDADPIFSADGSRQVAKTQGAKPLLELTDKLPSDIDYDRYNSEAQKLLIDIGAGSTLL